MGECSRGFRFVIGGLALVAWGLALAGPASAVTSTPVGPGVQCPNDLDNMPTGWSSGGAPGPEDNDRNGNGIFDADPNVKCVRLGVTDGTIRMSDGTFHYIFGFVDLTGVPEEHIVDYKYKANLPAPTIEVKEGQDLYITETNLGFFVRVDLADPHTLHFHGFPHAMAIFDGVPELSVMVPPYSDFTYYYKVNDPGTYPYHCHFEPTEHIQLGMVGTIIVKPAQDTPSATFAYNDGGLAPNTQYDVAYNLLLQELDAEKHHNLDTIQEGQTQWHTFRPHYYTLNGRSYPDTVVSRDAPCLPGCMYNREDYFSQPISSLITAQPNQRVLIRLVNLGFQTHTVTIPGIRMHVVGEDAKLLRGPDPDGAGPLVGKDLSFKKTVYSMAGGKTADIIIDTTGLNPGETYFLHARELNKQSGLSREDQLAGAQSENQNGMITEIRIVN
ncbi:MAG: multicopper oxidase domain-containing protein [Nitrospirota bacterium]